MIALACDHTGIALKREISAMLDEMGLEWKDFGNNNPDRGDDYPVYGYRAAEAVARWLLSPEGQALIVKGWMHSVLAGTELIPYKSVNTDELIRKDLGVDWERAYREREEINNMWTVKVTQ